MHVPVFTYPHEIVAALHWLPVAIITPRCILPVSRKSIASGVPNPLRLLPDSIARRRRFYLSCSPGRGTSYGRRSASVINVNSAAIRRYGDAASALR